MMELVNVTKVYQQGRRTVQAVAGVSLTVAAGEFISIMGPSGSGKSTLMHLLGALDTPTTGEVLFQGRRLSSMSDREQSQLRRTQIGEVAIARGPTSTIAGGPGKGLHLWSACPAPRANASRLTCRNRSDP